MFKRAPTCIASEIAGQDHLVLRSDLRHPVYGCVQPSESGAAVRAGVAGGYRWR
jgi:hypothetical protein